MTDGIDVFASMTDGQLLVGQTGLAPLAKSITGDGSPSAAGVWTNTQLAAELYYKIPTIFGMLPNARGVQGIATALATGDTDLYTCPANKRALVAAVRGVGLNAAGTTTIFAELKSGGAYYRIGNNATNTTAQTSATLIIGGFIILEAGESLAINVATNTGSSAFWSVVEFDSTSTVKSKKILGPATGDNTGYTVPALTSAVPLSTSVSGGVGVAVFAADSGGNRIWKNYQVKSGQAIGLAYQCVETQTVNASTANTRNVNGTMGPGDFWAINVDTGNAAQIAWINIMEMAHS